MDRKWQRKWRTFVRSGTDVRAHFERAEYYALHSDEFRAVLDAHPQEKLQLWALRQQLYEGDCKHDPPSMFDKYRFPEFCEKRDAWAAVQGMSPALAASKFEKLVRELDPRYMFWPMFPHGPSIQFQMAIRIQAAARRFLACRFKVKQQMQKVKQIRQLHMLGRMLVESNKPHFSGMRVLSGFTVPEAQFVHEVSKTTGLLAASKKLCSSRNFGGFVIIEDTAYFCKDVPFTLDRIKFRDDMCNLYLMVDTDREKGDKIQDAVSRLEQGVEVVKHTYQAGSSPVKLYMEPVRARLSFSKSIKRKTVGLFMSDVAELRIGPRTAVFESNGTVLNPNLCLSLVGSECVMDLEWPTEELRDFWAERLALLRERFQPLTARLESFERNLTTQSGWRKPFSMTELLCMNQLKDELTSGFPVVKFAGNGTWENRFLWLGYLKDITIDQSGRRPRLTMARERGRVAREEETMKGVDIADISAIRPGIAASNFDEAKVRIDLRDIEHECLSIIGSERSLCLQCLPFERDGIEFTAEQTRDHLVKGLRLLVFGCPRVLGTLEKSDEAVARVLNGQPANLASRYGYMLVPRADRKFEEKAVLDASNQAAFKMAGNLAEDFNRPLTAQEERRFEAAFAMFDKDGSGEIDANELLSAMQLLGKRLDLVDAKRLIDDYDFDGNGVMDLPEFFKMMQRENAVEKAVESMEDIFYQGLMDKTSKIPEAHFRAVMGSFPNANNLLTQAQPAQAAGETYEISSAPLTNEEKDALVDLVDTDHDGAIKPEEFLVAINAAFID